MTVLQNDIGALESQVAAQAKQISDCGAAVTGNSNDIAALKVTASAQANDIAALKAAVAKLQSAPTPAPVTNPGLITQFSGANKSQIMIDGAAAYTQNASQAWSLTEADDHTLRFEVRSGDHWVSDGTSGVERSEIALAKNYAPGTQINLDYLLTVEPGALSTSKWLVLNQMHATTEGSPPFAFYLNPGDKLQVALRYQPAGQAATSIDIWNDTSPLVRGHAYHIKAQVKFDPTGNGILNVWRDDVQIVKYSGPLGMDTANYYWKQGIYRAPTPETIAVSFRNLNITTG